VAEPPYLEVRGAWERPLAVSLLRWEEHRGQFVLADQTNIPPPQAANSRILELWLDTSPDAGSYRLELGSLPEINLRIANPETTPPSNKLDVRLEIQAPDGVLSSKELTTSDLQRGTLVARAWPHAQLSLQVSTGTQSRRLRISTDDAGEWRARWRDLGLMSRDIHWHHTSSALYFRALARRYALV
jgi:hypothetical protein